MNNYIYPTLTYNLIQTIRLSQALMETDFNVCIPKEEEYKFKFLRKFFDIDYSTKIDQGIKIENFEIDHKLPKSQIGIIERPLIFPRSIVDYCRNLWVTQRNFRFTFSGLLTEKRSAVLEQLCLRNCPDMHFKLQSSHGLSSSILGKIRDRIIRRSQEVYHIKDFHFFFSRRGRVFPLKCWDSEYYKLLSRSCFALCPSGDYVWTYRFFEAALCGAIPVVEKSCDAYNGFRYYLMSDKITNLQWDPKSAEHNFALCSERLTIHKKVLNEEIQRLIAQNKSA